MMWSVLTVLIFHLCAARLQLGPEPEPVPTPDLDSELIPYIPNRAPCMPSPNNGMNERFIKHHLCKLSNLGTDLNLWSKYIKQLRICKDKSGVKSFIDKSQLVQVNQVCSPSGGKLFETGRNLCISKKRFDFVEVRWDSNCKVSAVDKKTKYIILACDKIQNQCLPVHFESNPKNRGPNKHALDCGRTEVEGSGEVERNDV